MLQIHSNKREDEGQDRIEFREPDFESDSVTFRGV